MPRLKTRQPSRSSSLGNFYAFEIPVAKLVLRHRIYMRPAPRAIRRRSPSRGGVTGEDDAAVVGVDASGLPPAARRPAIQPPRDPRAARASASDVGGGTISLIARNFDSERLLSHLLPRPGLAEHSGMSRTWDTVHQCIGC